MNLIRDLADLPARARSGALAIGNFDGVHRGHAQIVERLVAQARQLGGPAVVFTFEPHPARLLRPEAAPAPLLWIERKAALLSALGVDWTIVYPTDLALLRLSAEEFFEEIVCRRLAAQAMVEGTNFYFGRDRRGTIERLAELTAERGMTLEVVPPVEIDGLPVSSSRIRQALDGGRVEEAADLLGRLYRLRGTITRGARRGRPLGFPTANLTQVDTLLPSPGVYAGYGWLAGRGYRAAIHLGANPTFGEAQQKVEVHLLDLDGAGDLYGESLEVDFARRLRDTCKFANVDALSTQLRRDVAAAGELPAAAAVLPLPGSNE